MKTIQLILSSLFFAIVVSIGLYIYVNFFEFVVDSIWGGPRVLYIVLWIIIGFVSLIFVSFITGRIKEKAIIRLRHTSRSNALKPYLG